MVAVLSVTLGKPRLMFPAGLGGKSYFRRAWSTQRGTDEVFPGGLSTASMNICAAFKTYIFLVVLHQLMKFCVLNLKVGVFFFFTVTSKIFLVHLPKFKYVSIRK